MVSSSTKLFLCPDRCNTHLPFSISSSKQICWIFSKLGFFAGLGVFPTSHFLESSAILYIVISRAARLTLLAFVCTFFSLYV